MPDTSSYIWERVKLVLVWDWNYIKKRLHWKWVHGGIIKRLFRVNGSSFTAVKIVWKLTHL